ncbi:conserved hypothetical protein [Hyphomicrobiales bacterium]|nr:conserved hypothetical protein [Hyphomicrobiales bacterium]CAH1667750.1 conserved hypothetical protein [Hyphomicrobiales bacterium]
MKDGLYKVTYETHNDYGWGLVHLSGGKLWGGDISIYYTGGYAVHGDQLTARVKTQMHTDVPEIESVFGRAKNTIQLEGACDETSARLTGRADQSPGIEIRLTLEFLHD